MVRETRYLWVGNLPEKITEEKISEKFSGHGKIQSVKLLPAQGSERRNAIVAFMDIKSASKAQNCENVIDSVIVQTQYSEPGAVISQRPPANVDLKKDASTLGAPRPPPSTRIPLKGEGYGEGKDRKLEDGEQSERGRSKQRHHKKSSKDSSRKHVSRSKSGRSKSGSSSSSSGSISSTSRSRSRSKDKAAERKKTLASAVSQPRKEQSHGGGGGGGGGGGSLHYMAIMIRGFPVRSTDSSIRDGLFHEYKKYGKVTSVSMIDNGTEPRHAVVSFKKYEDAKKSLEMTNAKVFFGSRISVTAHKGFQMDDSRFRPPEAEQDEYHHKATRTLFVGNLEMEIGKEFLRDIFSKHGLVIDIDIKKQGNQAAYAFIQYDDIKSVVRALRDMDGETIGKSKVKLGFGKSMPTTCVWLDNCSESVSDKFLGVTFSRYGPVSYEVIDRDTNKALIYFDSLDIAQRAVNEMRGRALGGKKIQIDFASLDCQTLFFDNLERQGLITPEDRPDEKGRTFAQGGTFTAPVTTPPAATTTGFDSRRIGFKTRGFVSERGSASGRGRGYQTSRRGFYDRGGYDSFGERRTGRYYEDDGEVNEPSTYGDDYESELREYYSQREREQPAGTAEKPRRESRADSPYSKSGRFVERYEERGYEPYEATFRDTDSQSGDPDSVRSFESRKEFMKDRTSYSEHYSDRFIEDTKRERTRAGSPANSEFSFRSRSPKYYARESRSPSPVSRKGKERSHKVQSPITPTLEDFDYGSHAESSVDILSGKRIKKTSKHRDFSDKEGDKYDSEERTSIKPKVGSRISVLDSDKHSRLYRSKEDLMDIDKPAKAMLYDKHWRSPDHVPKKKKVPTATLR